MIRKTLWMVFGASALFGNDGAIVTHSEFSYINTKGNTNTSSLAFEGSAKTSVGLNIFRANVNAYVSSDNGETSKNKWSSELNYDYQFCPRVSLNYLGGYKQDRFSGFDYQFYTGPGMGVKLLDEPKHHLDLQANLLYGRDKPDNLSADGYFSSKLGGIYRWQVQENLKFIQEATYRINLEDTRYNFGYSKSAVETKINASLSMGVSYKVDYINTPPPPSQPTDRTFLASLIIDY